MKITGRVLDVSNDAPLAGASIIILDKSGSETGTGTQTDSSGNFSLDSALLDNLYNKVSFSYVDYSTETMQPSAAKGDVYLSAAGDTLGAFVVIGKHSIKKPVIIATLITAVIVTAFIILFLKSFKQTIKI